MCRYRENWNSAAQLEAAALEGGADGGRLGGGDVRDSFEVLQGRLPASGIEMDHSAVAVRSLEIRRALQDCVEQRERFLALAEVHERDGQVVLGGQVAGIALQRLLEVLFGVEEPVVGHV